MLEQLPPSQTCQEGTECCEIPKTQHQSSPGQLQARPVSLPAAVTLSCPCRVPPQPGARAQQHLGVRRVKVEEGQETFVQLPQHLIWARGRGESTQETSQSPHWSAQSVPLGKAQISFYCKPQGPAAKFTTRSEQFQSSRSSLKALGWTEHPPRLGWDRDTPAPRPGHCWPRFGVSEESRAKAWIKINFFGASLSRCLGVHHL